MAGGNSQIERCEEEQDQYHSLNCFIAIEQKLTAQHLLYPVDVAWQQSATHNQAGWQVSMLLQ